jgi:hypothetical protein
VTALTFAIERVAARLPGPPQTVLLAGEGEFLAKVALEEQKAFPTCQAVLLSQTLGAAISQAACAHAVATMALDEKRT